MNTIERALKTVLLENDLPLGTSLENRVTWRLYRWKALDKVQYRVGKYRLDYAWPAIKVALEADGPHHWHPDNAIKDVARDSWLRSQGWLVFRVDDVSDDLEEQICRVVVMVGNEMDHKRIKWPVVA